MRSLILATTLCCALTAPAFAHHNGGHNGQQCAPHHDHRFSEKPKPQPAPVQPVTPIAPVQPVAPISPKPIVIPAPVVALVSTPTAPSINPTPAFGAHVSMPAPASNVGRLCDALESAGWVFPLCEVVR